MGQTPAHAGGAPGRLRLAVVGIALFIVWHNVSLRGQLDQALAEERLAREREQQALADQRLARLQNEGQKLFDNARLAAAARDWPTARLHLTKALATIGGEAQLEALKEPAQVLLQQVEQELRVEADRQASHDRLRQFVKLRDEAQFLGTLYTGMDLAANLNATRAAVQQALAVYGVAVDNDARPALDAYLNDAQKAEILGDCYQLLLILAETKAQSAADPKDAAQAQPVREALRLLEQSLRFGAPSRAYHLRRARYLRLVGDGPAAMQAEKAAQGATVDNVLDHFLVADEFYRRESFDDAIKEFNEVLERHPTHFSAQYLSALCLLRQHRPAEARAQLSAAITQRADFVWLYLLRGFAQSELQAFAAADADFQKARQMPLDDYARYVLFVNRGVLRVRQQRFDDAVADLQTAITLKPKEYQAYVNLADAYRQRKQLDLAVEQLQRTVQLEPELAHVYRLRARLHLERQEPALALSDFDQAIRRENPSSPLYADDQVERGRLLLRDRKYPEALAAFETALAGARITCRRSACGPRRCSTSAVIRRSSRRSTATWRPASRWSRCIAAAGWRGRSWANIPVPSRISAGRWSCTRPRRCRPTVVGRIWCAMRRSWRCATSSWRFSSIPRTATLTTAGASCARDWADMPKPCRTPRKRSGSGRRRHG